jgi:phosphohistidine phosphatase
MSTPNATGPAIALVHHADAIGPDVDPQRPLSSIGLAHADALAERAKAAGVKPVAIWHSGKLRARQTAEAFYRHCNPFAEFRMVRGLRPEDAPEWMRDQLMAESRDVMVVSHMPILPALLRQLSPESAPFPAHGIVVLRLGDVSDVGRREVREIYRGS